MSIHNLCFEEKHETSVVVFFFLFFFLYIVEQACFRNVIVYQFPISLIYFTINVLKIQSSDWVH